MKKAFSIFPFAASILTGLLAIGSISPALKAADSKGSARILFETNYHEFGKLDSGTTLSGVFKFKNTGDAPLKIDPPEPSCDCTTPSVQPDIVAPGGTGEILYTVSLDRAVEGERYIKVHSNDTDNPFIKLTFHLDYVPAYEISPKSLRITLPAGKEEEHATYTITRADGKPIDIDRFKTSYDWITAAIDPASKPQEGSAQIIVTMHRPVDPPSLIKATVEMWNNNQSLRPVQTIPLSGEIIGEIAAIPPRLFWVIPDFGKNKSDYPAEMLTRKIEVASLLGHEIELKNATSNIKGLTVATVPKDAGKKFDLVLKFDELPQTFTNGEVTVETSLKSLPKVTVPISISLPGR